MNQIKQISKLLMLKKKIISDNKEETPLIKKEISQEIKEQKEEPKEDAIKKIG